MSVKFRRVYRSTKENDALNWLPNTFFNWWSTFQTITFNLLCLRNTFNEFEEKKNSIEEEDDEENEVETKKKSC